MGFAHPAFTMQNLLEKDMLEGMNNFIKRSNGTLKLAEKYHQAYPFGNSISHEELEKYNKILDQLNLVYMGGRDNHTPKLF